MLAVAIYCIFLIVYAALGATQTETSSNNNNIGCISRCNSEDIFNISPGKSSNIVSSNPDNDSISDDKKPTRSDIGRLHSVDSDGSDIILQNNNNNYIKGRFVRIHFGIVHSDNRSNTGDIKGNNNNNNNSNDNKKFIRIHFERKFENSNTDNTAHTFSINSIKGEIICEPFRTLSKLNDKDTRDTPKYSNNEEKGSDEKGKLIHIHLNEELNGGINDNRKDTLTYTDEDNNSEKRVFVLNRIELMLYGENNSNNLESKSEDKNDERKPIRSDFAHVYKSHINRGSNNAPKSNSQDRYSNKRDELIRIQFSYKLDESNNNSSIRSDVLKNIEEGEHDKRRFICFPRLLFDDRNSSSIFENKSEDKSDRNNYIHICIISSVNNKTGFSILKTNDEKNKSNNNNKWFWRILACRIYNDSSKTNNQSDRRNATKLILNRLTRKYDCTSFSDGTQKSTTVELLSSGSLNEMNGTNYINLSGNNKKEKLFLTDCCGFFVNNNNINTNIPKISGDDSKGKFICTYGNSSNILKYNEEDNNSDKKGWIIPDWNPKAFDDRNNSCILKSNKDISDKKNVTRIYDIIFNENNSAGNIILIASDDNSSNSNGRKRWLIWFRILSLSNDSNKTTNDIGSKDGGIGCINFRLRFDNSNSSSTFESKNENKDKNKFICINSKNNTSKWKIEWFDSIRIFVDGNKIISSIMKNSSTKSRNSARVFIRISNFGEFRDANSVSNNTQKNTSVELTGNISSSKIYDSISIILDDSLCSKSVNDNDNSNNNDKKLRIHSRWAIKIHKSNSILKSNNEDKNAKKYFVKIQSGSTHSGSKRNSSSSNNPIEFIHINFAIRTGKRRRNNADALKNNNEINKSDQKKFIRITFSAASRYSRDKTNIFIRDVGFGNVANSGDNKEKSLCFEFDDAFKINSCRDFKFNDENSNNDVKKKFIRIRTDYMRKNNNSGSDVLKHTEQNMSDQKGEITCFPSRLFNDTSNSNVSESDSANANDKKECTRINFSEEPEDNKNNSKSNILKNSSEENNSDKKGMFINHRFTLAFGSKNRRNFRRSNSEGKNDKKKFIDTCFNIIINRTNNVGSTALKTNNKNNSRNSSKKWFNWIRFRYLFDDSNKTLKSSFQDGNNNAMKFINTYFLGKYSDSCKFINNTHNSINVKLLTNDSSIEVAGTFDASFNDTLCFNTSSKNNNEEKFYIHLAWVNSCYNDSSIFKNQNEIYENDLKIFKNTIVREITRCDENSIREVLRKNNVDDDGNNKVNFPHIKFRMKFDNYKNSDNESPKSSADDKITDAKGKFIRIHSNLKHQENDSSRCSIMKNNSEGNKNKKKRMFIWARPQILLDHNSSSRSSNSNRPKNKQQDVKINATILFCMNSGQLLDSSSGSSIFENVSVAKNDKKEFAQIDFVFPFKRDNNLLSSKEDNNNNKKLIRTD
ncbi:unnamed protein product [Gongylonema pulchrum]|uniref:Subtilisin n=1 Tax=Gongylonema pulchrum TaxID=637853 RepID=A0A183CUX8_9BILA|nr:unnamed protein product [Gongylonema pulchrum]